MAVIAKIGLRQSRGLAQGLPHGQRDPRIWVICWCFPRCIFRELDQKPGYKMGCQSRWRLHILSSHFWSLKFLSPWTHSGVQLQSDHFFLSVWNVLSLMTEGISWRSVHITAFFRNPVLNCCVFCSKTCHWVTLLSPHMWPSWASIVSLLLSLVIFLGPLPEEPLHWYEQICSIPHLCGLLSLPVPLDPPVYLSCHPVFFIWTHSSFIVHAQLGCTCGCACVWNTAHEHWTVPAKCLQSGLFISYESVY